MSTSPLGYRVVIGWDAFSAQRPLSAFDTRNVVLNNLCHYADSYGQTLVNWSATAAALTGGYGYLYPGSPADLTGYLPSLIGMWKVPLRIRADGSSYKVRIRIGGASDTAGESVRFFAALALPGYGIGRVLYDGTVLAGMPALHGDAIFGTVATTSTTPAWLTGVSQGNNGWSTMIQLPADLVSSHLRMHGTFDETSAPESVLYTDTILVVFSLATHDGIGGRLYAVHACEWVGT